MIYSKVIEVCEFYLPELKIDQEENFNLDGDTSGLEKETRFIIKYMLDLIPIKERVGMATVTQIGRYVEADKPLINRTLPHMLGNTILVKKKLDGKQAAIRLGSQFHIGIFGVPRQGGCLMMATDDTIKVFNGELDVPVDSHGYIPGRIKESNFITLKEGYIYYLSSQAIMKYIVSDKKVYKGIFRFNLPRHALPYKLRDKKKISNFYLEKYGV